MYMVSEAERWQAYLRDVNSSPLSMCVLDRYRAWAPGDIVLMATPTGSGKSTFIRKTLCNPVLNPSNQQCPILYLVNRSVLKEQFMNDIYNDIIHGNQNCKFIDVWTYQQIEQQLIKGGEDAAHALTEQFEKYVYVILDECHYFLFDSTYNTATCISFNFINRIFSNRIRIFMSATSENIRLLLFERFGYPECQDNCEDHMMGRYRLSRLDGYYYEYNAPADYSYIYPHSFNSPKDIPKIIEDHYDGTKWLIFVNNKSRGLAIRNALLQSGVLRKKNLSKEDVIYIDAGYKKSLTSYPLFYNEEGPVFYNEENGNQQRIKNTVKQLKWQQRTDIKILICTSVFDNGISFHDPALRNIIILADTREAFIQMLGRKRIDKERIDADSKINLYLCKRNVSYFMLHLQQKTTALDAYRKYKKSIKNMGNSLSARQSVLEDILSEETVRQELSCFCYTRYGKYLINPLSIRQLRYEQVFHSQMAESLRKDPDAFFHRQLEWLGMAAGKEKEIWHQMTIECIQSIIEEFIQKGPFTAIENKQFKSKLKDPLIKLLKSDHPNLWKNDIRKLGSLTLPLSSKRFNKIMESKVVNLPYRMTGPYGTQVYFLTKL